MRKLSELIVLVRGGGEVGSAVAHRLQRSHFHVCITEIAQPLAVSRGTCFCEAVYDVTKTIEGVTAELTEPALEKINQVWRNGHIPILVDPDMSIRPLLVPEVLVNAVMAKQRTDTQITEAPLVIGIGPGFFASRNVHLVVESNNSNSLGRVIELGESDENTGTPMTIGCIGKERVVWASAHGVFTTWKNIGDSIQRGETVGKLDSLPLKAPVSGMIRGLLRSGLSVPAGTKLIEIDPVNDRSACLVIRDRMRAIAGGVLEAIMLSLNTDR